jgi:crossover junction endodeoxyribonuclease RuvC
VRILGIDPGSMVTGFGVIDHVRGVLSIVEHGCISPRRGDVLASRLSFIHEQLTEVIHRTRPDAVAVEAPFHGPNVKSLIQLSHARGVILLGAQNAGLAVFEYSPRSVKSAVVGYGGAEKHQVEHMVRLLIKGLHGQKIPADAADALAIAVCHAHTHREIRLAVVRGARSSG